MVLYRWGLRHRARIRVRRLDRETQSFIGEANGPSSVVLWGERIIVLLGLSAVCCFVWGFIEPHTIDVTYHRVLSRKLSGSRLRIVHLSDIHSEAKLSNEARVVSTIANLRPDLIVFTGDALNTAKGLNVFRETMGQLSKIAPTYSVRGNWETWWFPDLDLYSRTGVQPIDGQARALSIQGQTIWIGGVGVDHEDLLAKVTRRVPARSFFILLSHFPFVASQAAKQGVDLLLAGDTHGGQIRVPFFGELVRIERHGIWRKSGLSRERAMWLYVNRGLGNEGGIPKFRFNCPPEIAVLDLVGE